MTTYIRAANPIWFMVDLTGEPLNDEYYAFFLQNTFPYLPAAVYRDPNGNTVWTGGIVQFQPSGTLPNNLYFADDQTYRIEIRRGNSQSDPLIWEIDDFEPGAGGATPSGNVSLNTENQVSNPQFAFVLFSSPLVITTSGTHSIAPGWDLVLTGSGTATLTQLDALKGTDNILTNPAYGLRIQLTGWTEAKLIQRFSQNGSIWAATTLQPNSSVTLSAIAISNDGVARDLSIGYQPSNALSPTPVASGTLSTTQYTAIAGAVELPASTNSTANPDAYVDLVITLPNTSDISISSVQAIGENTDEPITLPYEQTTVERQQDHLFHYYADSILNQSKHNLLTGWNFGVNPWQFRDTASSNVANNAYTADQTIIIQQNYVKNNTGNNVAVGRGSLANNYSFDVTAVTALNQFAILNLVDPETMRPYWGKNVSVQARLKITTSHASEIRMKAKIIYWDNAFALPDVLARLTPIASWNETTNVIGLASNWSEINCLNDPEFVIGEEETVMNFHLFNLPEDTSTFMTLGLMLYTLDPMDQTATADVIHFSKVSLVNNDFAMDAAPETWDESFRKCQFYYQKTFANGVVPAQAVGSSIGALSYRVYSGGAVNGGILWKFPSVMRDTPTITSYNPVNANANWYNSTDGANSGAASFSGISQQSAFITDSQVAGDTLSDFINVHLTADARLAQ